MNTRGHNCFRHGMCFLLFISANNFYIQKEIDDFFFTKESIEKERFVISLLKYVMSHVTRMNLISGNVLFWYSIASFHQSERRVNCDICAPVIALVIHIHDCTIQKFIFSKVDIKSSITLIKSYVFQKNIFLCWTTDIPRSINFSGLVIFHVIAFLSYRGPHIRVEHFIC